MLKQDTNKAEVAQVKRSISQFYRDMKTYKRLEKLGEKDSEVVAAKQSFRAYLAKTYSPLKEKIITNSSKKISKWDFRNGAATIGGAVLMVATLFISLAAAGTKSIPYIIAAGASWATVFTLLALHHLSEGLSGSLQKSVKVFREALKETRVPEKGES